MKPMSITQRTWFADDHGLAQAYGNHATPRNPATVSRAGVVPTYAHPADSA